MRTLLCLACLGALALTLGLSGCVAATDSAPTVADGTRAEALQEQSADPSAEALPASQGTAAHPCPGCGRGPGFVDQDGDGVCDRMQSGQTGCGCMGKGPGFVDQDGDGVCDHRQRAGGERGRGPGPGWGRAGGRGRGPGFVDQNGDGGCDRMQAQSP
jgi:hypothetical protein